MKTQIITDDTLEIVVKAADLMLKMVSLSLGPKGGLVMFRKQGHRSGMTRDGVTIARMLESNDDAEDVVLEELRKVLSKMEELTRDATSTVAVLTCTLVKELVEEIKKGASPVKLQQGLNALQGGVLEHINEHTDKDITLEKLQAVASVAAKSKEIGDEVGRVVYEAGEDTPILLDFSLDDTTYTESIKGFKINSGPVFMGQVVTETADPRIVVVDAKLYTKEDVLPILKLFTEEKKLLLVCTDISSDALKVMVASHQQKYADITLAKVPSEIQNPSEYLSDLAVSCGAKVLSRNDGLLTPKLDDFGKAKLVRQSLRETIIIDGEAIEEDFNTRLEQLKSVKDPLVEDRIKTLNQKIVTIYIGAKSGLDDKFDRYDDSLGACRAALKGVVAGGGTVLYSAETGKILSKALKAPLETLLRNADIEVPKITAGHGIDVMNPEDGVVDLAKRGILDPAESEIEAVKLAIAAAGHLVLTGGMVVDERNKNETEPKISTGQS